ncbi:MAG: asparagine synthase (glutamine-hydrolyzing) [Acidobacteria bacterium]|nr:asparagine synthase (glutamine-hydrolyzing) [Acidobacteriota bacterium]
MCGLAGFWHPDSHAPAASLHDVVGRMADAIVYRGPDDRGTWVDEGAGVALGFRRLAILDLSPAGHQPMVSRDDRFVVTFNGEIYNYRDLRTELEGLGARFRGTSDTEVMLAGIERWGPAATIARLWGMFAIALWDRHDRTLWIARDRLGKKPLYYGWSGGTFLWGSELKALRAHPACPTSISPAALASFLRFAYVPSPYSIYEGLHKLPAGAYAVVRPGGTPRITRYWDPREVVEAGTRTPSRLDDAAAVEELDGLLRDATRRRMVADVPLGAFLSGGIDSSTVVSLMQAESPHPVRTFTIGFDEAGYDEAQDARAVAAHLGTAHSELYVTPEEARAVIPGLARMYDEPFADSSQIPTVLVAQMARRDVTVAVSGDGGDEVFGGYNRYVWAPDLVRRTKAYPRWARQTAGRLVTAVAPSTWDAVGRLAGGASAALGQRALGDKLHKLGVALSAVDADALYTALVSQWQSPPVAGAATAEPPWLLQDVRVQAVAPGFVERMMLVDTMTYLPDDILAKVDRASMAVSLEARAPLLDHRVVEWAWRQPLSRRIRGRQGKWALRQVLRKYVPDTLVDRPKAGFAVPIHAWLRGPLRPWAEALLSESALREAMLDPAPIRRAWHEHVGGRANHLPRLWTVLMWQAWRAEG